MTECYAKCESILTEHNDKLTLIAETLVKDEKISGEMFLKLMDENYNPEEEIAEDVNEEVGQEITENTEIVSDEVVAETEETTEE